MGRRALDVAQVPTGAPSEPPDSPGRRLVTAWTQGPRDLAALAALIDGALEGPVATLERTLDRLMEADTLHDCGCDGEADCPLCLAYEDVQEALAVVGQRPEVCPCACHLERGAEALCCAACREVRHG